MTIPGSDIQVATQSIIINGPGGSTQSDYGAQGAFQQNVAPTQTVVINGVTSSYGPPVGSTAIPAVNTAGARVFREDGVNNVTVSGAAYTNKNQGSAAGSGAITVTGSVYGAANVVSSFGHKGVLTKDSTSTISVQGANYTNDVHQRRQITRLKQR
jgi:peroxiredoxin